MKLKEIYDFLNEISPFEMQAQWDNSGLLLGDFDSQNSANYSQSQGEILSDKAQISQNKNAIKTPQNQALQAKNSQKQIEISQNHNFQAQNSQKQSKFSQAQNLGENASQAENQNSQAPSQAEKPEKLGENDIKEVYLALDVNEDLVKNAPENALFITHHPLIFGALKDLAGGKYPKKLLKMMIAKNQSLIAMHTNYDLSHLNAYFTEQVLGLKIASRDEFIIYADVNMKFTELLGFLKKKLAINPLKFTFSGRESIKKLAICTGSGGDLIEKVQADAFLSGDFKYHQALAALESGLSLVDVGHYESESCFAKSLAKNLQKLPIKTIMCVCKNPFSYS